MSFKYPTRDEQVLNNLSFTIKEGETTAIVGPSGSGKSTCVQLIERFYDAADGAVEVAGCNIREINLSYFRGQVGYVGQEPVLFNQSIRENLLYGNPDATIDDINEALERANAAKIVARLADGIETNVGSAGGQLSGGEKQRIALARAFIKKPKILILDEATSALDRANEREVQEAVDKIQSGDQRITVVVIAHRLSTIQNAHKIVVLDKGSKVEEGTHSELLSKGGLYSSLVKKQENVNQPEDKKVEDEVDEANAEEEPTDLNAPTLVKRRSSVAVIGEKRVTDSANQADEEKEEKVKKQREARLKTGFFSRVCQHADPKGAIVAGVFSSLFMGVAYPFIGFFFTKMVFALFITDDDELEKEVNKWAFYMFLLSVGTLIFGFIQKFFFGFLSENIAKSVRK